MEHAEPNGLKNGQQCHQNRFTGTTHEGVYNHETHVGQFFSVQGSTNTHDVAHTSVPGGSNDKTNRVRYYQQCSQNTTMPTVVPTPEPSGPNQSTPPQATNLDPNCANQGDDVMRTPTQRTGRDTRCDGHGLDMALPTVGGISRAEGISRHEYKPTKQGSTGLYGTTHLQGQAIPTLDPRTDSATAGTTKAVTQGDRSSRNTQRRV